MQKSNCSRYLVERLSFVFKKNSVWINNARKRIWLFIPFILLTFLKELLRRLMMSSRETIRLPFSSNWTGPVMPGISTFNKEEKQRLWLNLYGKVGLSLKRSSAWQNFVFWNWTPHLRRGCRTTNYSSQLNKQ